MGVLEPGVALQGLVDKVTAVDAIGDIGSRQDEPVHVSAVGCAIVKAPLGLPPDAQSFHCISPDRPKGTYLPSFAYKPRRSAFEPFSQKRLRVQGSCVQTSVGLTPDGGSLRFDRPGGRAP